MENSNEKGHERILSKEEVIEVIRGFAENAELVRELSDEQGLYLLEAKVEGEGQGEVIQYEYMRAGRFPNHNEASETAIHIMYYENGVAQIGNKLAVYNSETQQWDEVK